MQRTRAGHEERVGPLTRALALCTLAVAIGGVWVPLQNIGLSEYTAFEMSVPWAALMTAPAVIVGIGLGLMPLGRLRSIRLSRVRLLGLLLGLMSVGGVVGVLTYSRSDAFVEKFVSDNVTIAPVGWEPGLIQRYPYVLAVLVVATAIANLQLRRRSRTANDAITIAEPRGAPGPG